MAAEVQDVRVYTTVWPAGRNPLNGCCKRCGHVWVVAWLPMTIDEVAPMMKDARCPMCSCPDVNCLSSGG
jgi:hypothetical protein